MKLRDHPLLMSYGLNSWPPVWVNTRTVPVKKQIGEIGTLIRIAFFPETPKRLFLIMEFENEPYLGCLLFSEAGFCQQLNKILQDHVGLSIAEIGDMDLSHTL
jgi:hypothetical protein